MTKDTQTAIRLLSEHLLKLDELRRKEKDLPTRAEMMRRLIERAK